MKRILMTALFAVALTLSAFSSASAAPTVAPGTPGEANCKGQTIAYLAQAAKNGLLGGDVGPGLGNLADAAGVSVQDIQAIAVAFCAGEL